MADNFWMNGSDEIVVNGSGEPIDCVARPCGSIATACEIICVDATMPFAFTFVYATGNAQVTGSLTYSPTIIGGTSPGWYYDVAPSQTPVCSGSPSLSLRTVYFWCDGSHWQIEIVVVFNAIQDSYSTVGGTLNPVALLIANNPRDYYSRTAGSDTSLNVCGHDGYLLINVAVRQ